MFNEHYVLHKWSLTGEVSSLYFPKEEMELFHVYELIWMMLGYDPDDKTPEFYDCISDLFQIKKRTIDKHIDSDENLVNNDILYNFVQKLNDFVNVAAGPELIREWISNKIVVFSSKSVIIPVNKFNEYIKNFNIDIWVNKYQYSKYDIVHQKEVDPFKEGARVQVKNTNLTGIITNIVEDGTTTYCNIAITINKTKYFTVYPEDQLEILPILELTSKYKFEIGDKVTCTYTIKPKLTIYGVIKGKYVYYNESCTGDNAYTVPEIVYLVHVNDNEELPTIIAESILTKVNY